MEYVAVNDAGEVLRCQDSDDQTVALGCLGDLSDVMTTYSPRNAKLICDAFQRGKTVSCCSDLLVQCAVSNAEGDPTIVRDALRAQRCRCPNHGGFRRLKELDIVHYMLQTEWQKPRFKFTQDYFKPMETTWLAKYPLLPFFDFLGLDPFLSVCTIASWLDHRRFVVAADYDKATQALWQDYMDPPDMDMQLELNTAEGVDELFADEETRPCERRWCIAFLSWFSVLDVPAKQPTRLYTLFKRLQDAFDDMDDAERILATNCELTNIVIQYLSVHHQRELLEAGVGEVIDPFQLFVDDPDIAEAYALQFGHI